MIRWGACAHACVCVCVPMQRNLITPPFVTAPTTCRYREFPLSSAAVAGHAGVVRVLLDCCGKQVDVNQATTDTGITPLYTASQFGSFSESARSGSAFVPLTPCASVLTWACSDAGCATCRHPCDCAAKRSARSTMLMPLFYYYMYSDHDAGHTSVVRELLTVPNIDITEVAEFTTGPNDFPPVAPIHIAADMGHAEIVQLFLEYSHAKQKREKSPQKLSGVEETAKSADTQHGGAATAAVHGDSDAVGGNAGSNVGTGDAPKVDPDALVNLPAVADGSTLLHMAAQHGHAELATVLLASPGIDLNAEMHHDKVTPFWIACMNGNIEIVKLLLERRCVDVNKPSTENVSPLFTACAGGYDNIVKLLLDTRGDDLALNTRKDEDDYTPLHIAVALQNYAIVKMLLLHRRPCANAHYGAGTVVGGGGDGDAAATARASANGTAATSVGTGEARSAARAAGGSAAPSINVPASDDGSTPLMMAAAGEDPAIAAALVRMLLAHGGAAEIHYARPEDKLTALHVAGMSGNLCSASADRVWREH